MRQRQNRQAELPALHRDVSTGEGDPGPGCGSRTWAPLGRLPSGDAKVHCTDKDSPDMRAPGWLRIHKKVSVLVLPESFWPQGCVSLMRPKCFQLWRLIIRRNCREGHKDGERTAGVSGAEQVPALALSALHAINSLGCHLYKGETEAPDCIARSKPLRGVLGSNWEVSPWSPLCTVYSLYTVSWSLFSLALNWADTDFEMAQVPSRVYLYSVCCWVPEVNQSLCKDK